MNKYVSLILAFVLVVCLAVPAAAAGQPKGVYVEALDISVVVPDQYDAMMPDMKDNDPVFVQRGIQVPKFKKWAEDNGIYLWVLSKNGKSNFTITAEELEDAESFIECDPEYVSNTAEYMEEAFEGNGVKVTKAEVHDQGHAPFVRVDYEYTKEKDYNIQMFTVLDLYDEDDEISHVKYSVNFTSGTPIDAKTEKMVVDFVNSINWAVYYNSTTGVYFVPNGQWIHYDINETDDCKAWFRTSADKEPFGGVSYSYMDLMEDVDNMDREDVNMDMFDKDSLAELLGMKPGDLGEYEYNDNTYYGFAMEEQQGTGKVYSDRLIHVNNGYVHMFMNIEEKKGTNVKVFEDFMETVVFPD